MKKYLLLITVIIPIIFAECNQNTNNTKWSVAVSKDFIAKYPCADSIHWIGQKNHFSWQAGYIMFAMEKMWRITGDSAYFNYIKK